MVGAERATEALRDDQTVTVSCAEGDTGKVYDGAVPFRVDRIDLGRLPRPQTRIMVNLGNLDQAFQTGQLPVDGVGLARMEFIISEAIKVHPMALVHPERVEDADVRARIARLTRNHPDGGAYFVERLSEGIGTIAAAFFPRPVIVRLSDFKTNEYASLIGGRWFEPVEENPMLGFRGASRYAHPAYEKGFALECRALARVRGAMGLTNVKVMVPFCRRLEEADRVIAAMARHGLERGRDGLEIYVMCEIPNNVLLVDEFAQRFDGFSIGSNDLTQLTLGVDRDSPLVAFDFDERDPGVLAFLRQAVEGAKRNGRPCGICGQAPSDYPEVAEFLVRLGITSISLTPDSVLRTLRAVVELEQRLGRALRSPGLPGSGRGDAGLQGHTGHRDHGTVRHQGGRAPAFRRSGAAHHARADRRRHPPHSRRRARPFLNGADTGVAIVHTSRRTLQWRGGCGVRACRLVQQADDVGIVELAEVLVEGADGAERERNLEADNLIGFGPQLQHGVERRHRHGQHQPPRARTAHRAQGGAHRRAGRDAVVHEDDGAPGDRRARTAVDVHGPPALDLPDLAILLRLDPGGGHVLRNLRVDDGFDVTAIGHGTDGQLWLERCADLAHEHDVERRVERPRDLAPDRNAAARQSQDDRFLVAEVHQPCGEASAGFAPVTEPERHAGAARRRCFGFGNHDALPSQSGTTPCFFGPCFFGALVRGLVPRSMFPLAMARRV